MNLIPQSVCTLGAIIALCYAFEAARRMTCGTHHLIRVAYILIAAGSFWEVVAIFRGHVPGIAESLFIAGIGILAVMDRRSVRCRSVRMIDRESPT